jgi:Family of unknown function (DUF5670)
MSTLAVILAVVWLLATISSYTLHGLTDVLLVLAIGMVLPRVIQGRAVSN